MARRLFGGRVPSIDVDSPEKVADALEAAADAFAEDAARLDAEWQDPDAGDGWDLVSLELTDTASRIRKGLKDLGY